MYGCCSRRFLAMICTMVFLLIFITLYFLVKCSFFLANTRVIEEKCGWGGGCYVHLKEELQAKFSRNMCSSSFESSAPPLIWVKRLQRNDWSRKDINLLLMGQLSLSPLSLHITFLNQTLAWLSHVGVYLLQALHHSCWLRFLNTIPHQFYFRPTTFKLLPKKKILIYFFTFSSLSHSCFLLSKR